MTDPNDEAARAAAVAKLKRLVDMLGRYRAELEVVDRGDQVGMVRLRLLIRLQHNLIRKQCLLSGLERPMHVPERDGGE